MDAQVSNFYHPVHPVYPCKLLLHYKVSTRERTYRADSHWSSARCSRLRNRLLMISSPPFEDFAAGGRR